MPAGYILTDMGNSYFSPGDVVESNSGSQGLQVGLRYDVVRVDERRLPFGNFCHYVLRPVGGGEEVRVGNGHLLLERVPS